MSDDMLRKSIEPKSDQLNADDLLGTTKTITVVKVARGTTDQPVFIHYDDENGRPYKPCKSMRRVLIGAWGDNGADWAGRSMTLYCDPAVKFGGVAVGGIRISHLSHIERDISMMLTTTRGKKSEYRVKAMNSADMMIERINASKSIQQLHDAFAEAWKKHKNDDDASKRITKAKDARKAELEKMPTTVDSEAPPESTQ